MVLLERKQRNNYTFLLGACILGAVLLIIDNYDSFTFNVVQRIGELDVESGVSRTIKVVRNDQLTLQDAIALQPKHLLISPGPCTPDQSGVSRELIAHFRGKIPIMGVCLGHQAIADLYGMKVMQYKFPVHGKTSKIHHEEQGLFSGIPNPFEATRYHSLVVEPDSIPSDFSMSAWTEDGICMGLRWKGDGAMLEGVQFHPESFLTKDGPLLFKNFLYASGG
jgi:anthranilate synthase/aminodeoxychorismate synthase-like glutamine amidotransferase|tara:strand:+ start:1501 stop:2166 length:666 start_codon:yes stop_codon:yes gene_type:complete